MQEDEPKLGPSALAGLLIHMWTWGDMSTPLMQKLAAAAVADGLAHDELQKLAALGSHGKYSNNMHSELMTKLQPSPIADAVSSMSVYFKKDGQNSVESHVSIILPHELFAIMHQKHPDHFAATICGGVYRQRPKNMG